MDEAYVHPRVMERHPNLREEEVLSAWKNAFEMAIRATPEGDRHVAVGSDAKGRLIEMVAVKEGNSFLIFHAMTPPTGKTLVELGLQGR